MPFKISHFLLGLSTLGVSSAVGYSLLNPKNQENNNNSEVEDLNREDTLNPKTTPGGLNTSDETHTELESTEGQDQKNKNLQEESTREQSVVIADKEENKTFEGYLLFNVDNANYKIDNASKTGTKNFSYEMSLLDSEKYEEWNKEEKETMEEEMEEEGVTEGTRNFAVGIKTKVPKSRVEEYLNELNQKLKSHENSIPGSTGVYDKGALKDYFEKNKDDIEKNFKDYFEEKTYEKVIKELKKESN